MNSSDSFKENLQWKTEKMKVFSPFHVKCDANEEKNGVYGFMFVQKSNEI